MSYNEKGLLALNIPPFTLRNMPNRSAKHA